MFNIFIKVFKLKQILKAISQDICFDFEFFLLFGGSQIFKFHFKQNEFF